MNVNKVEKFIEDTFFDGDWDRQHGYQKESTVRTVKRWEGGAGWKDAKFFAFTKQEYCRVDYSIVPLTDKAVASEYYLRRCSGEGPGEPGDRWTVHLFDEDFNEVHPKMNCSF